MQTNMPDQVATTSSPFRSVRRIATLLSVIIAALMMAFCYFASSFCITIVLSAFLAVLVDPLVTHLERWRLSRSLSATLLIITGMVSLGFLGHTTYKFGASFVDTFPLYAGRIRSAVQPVSQKIEKVQETAGSLTTPDASPKKKITEVQLKDSPTWPSYLIRGFGSVWGAAIILTVVPFLTFFMLVRKEQTYLRLTRVFGDQIDLTKFAASVSRMIRGYVLGNLMIGFVMAAVTIAVLLGLKVQGAVGLGIVSGFLNLIPFLGVLLAVLLPLLAALLQFTNAGPFLIIIGTVLFLHVVSANLLIPKLVGSRVSIGPVAATVGILFWSWLWGVMGLLLAIPLTAFIKLVADSYPSLVYVSTLLDENPQPAARWVVTSEAAIKKAVPYFRRKFMTET